MIPISEIDSLIEHHEGHGISIDYDDVDVINILKRLKQKAIPVVSNDELVKELQEIYNLGNHWEAWLRLDKVIKDLKKLNV